MKIGDRIRDSRKEKGLTQQNLADMSGISRVTLGFYERNENVPPSDVLGKIAEKLGVSTDYLLHGETVEDITMQEVLQKGLTAVNILLKQSDAMLSYIELAKNLGMEKFSEISLLANDYVEFLAKHNITHAQFMEFLGFISRPKED